MISLPLTIIVLMLVLGALVAAGLPLLVALTAVVATMGLLAIPSQLIPVDSGIGVILLLIGLAVGVDYSLFYMRREREERAAGRSERAALEAAAATSGRAILISGITVMIAMAGMFLTGDKTFMSFSVGTMLVVAVAMIGSLTVLPAMLSKLGDRVEKGRSRSCSAPPSRRRRRHLERDPRPRAPPPGRLGRRSPAGCSSRWPLPALTCTPRRRASTAAAEPPAVQPFDSCRTPSRASPNRPVVGSRPTTSAPGGPRRSPSSSARRSRPGR